jgi:hypothetical protein
MSEVQGLAPSHMQPENTSSISIPPPSPPPPPSLQILRSWLPLYLSKTDAAISKLDKILSTPAGTDTVLLTLCYSTLLTSTILTRISLTRLRRSAQQIIEKAISLPANTTVIISTSDIPTSHTAVAAARLKALSGVISEFRIFARLWGLLGIYKWGKGVVAGNEEDLVLKSIAYGQVLVNIFYQYLENGAYLSSKGVMSWSKERQGSAWIWSSRCWMAHVAMDFVRLGREAILRKEQNLVKGKEVKSLEEGKWNENWRKQMVVNLAYAPLTVHWSLEEGLVSEFWVGLCGTVAGMAGLRARWNDA